MKRAAKRAKRAKRGELTELRAKVAELEGRIAADNASREVLAEAEFELRLLMGVIDAAINDIIAGKKGAEG